MSRIAILCIMLFGITISSSAQDLENLWKVAQSSNPQILEAEYTWYASEKALNYKGFWPNPILKASYINLPTGDLDFGRTPMSGKQLMIMQNVPFWNAPIKDQIARYQMQVNRADYDLVQLEVKEKLTHVYYSLWYDNEEKIILEKNLALLQKMVTIAQSRYESGKGLEQDVLRAQVESKLMENQLLKNKQKQASDYATLGAILGGKEIAFKNNTILLEKTVGHFFENKIIEVARANNPEIRKLHQTVKLFEKKHDLASSSWIPDLDISGYYTWRDDITGDPVRGEDFVGASVGISIPIMFPIKESSISQEGLQKLLAKQKKLETVEHKIIARIKSVVSKLNQLISSEKLYRQSILPQSDAAVESAMTAYQTGKVEFLTVVNNEAMLINQQLAYKRIVRDIEFSKARLITLSGDYDVLKEVKQ